MFAVLQISDKNTILQKPKIQSQRINLPSGDAFFIVTADKHMGKIPWRKLQSCLGILRHSMILPEDMTVPDNINISTFTPDIFPQLLLINSATAYIRKHKEIFLTKSLTVFDKDGIYIEYIEKLLPCFRNITVVTEKTDIYNTLSLKLLSDYGFSLVVSSQENFKCDVVISHTSNVPLYFSGTLFTSEKKYIMGAEVFTGTEIELPDLYEKLRPQNIGKVLFASALYENCSEKSLGNLQYIDFGC